MKNITFNTFCYLNLDGLYNPQFSEAVQSKGYLLLKRMVEERIDPAPLDEIKRWEEHPTSIELTSVPDLKYLQFLHPLLRPYVIDNWYIIKTLPIE